MLVNIGKCEIRFYLDVRFKGQNTKCQVNITQNKYVNQKSRPNQFIVFLVN